MARLHTRWGQSPILRVETGESPSTGPLREEQQSELQTQNRGRERVCEARRERQAEAPCASDMGFESYDVLWNRGALGVCHGQLSWAAVPIVPEERPELISLPWWKRVCPDPSMCCWHCFPASTSLRLEVGFSRSTLQWAERVTSLPLSLRPHLLPGWQGGRATVPSSPQMLKD